MKRGVVMEVSKHKAVILTKDGSFERVRLKKGEQPTLGQEYIFPMKPRHSYVPMRNMVLPTFSLALSIVIIFVLIAGAFPFGQNKALAAAYVSFDINPSIEVAVDDEMKIIKVRALNEDAEQLLSNSESFQNMSLLYFSESLFQMLDESGYLDTYHDLLITTSLEDDSLELEVKQLLQSSISDIRQSPKLKGKSVVVSVMNTTLSTRELANQNGVSMGKYLVYQNVLDQGRTLTLDDVNKLSYTELKNLAATDADEDSDDSKTVEVEPTEHPEHVNRTIVKQNQADSESEVTTEQPAETEEKATVSNSSEKESAVTVSAEEDKSDSQQTLPEKPIQTVPKKKENANANKEKSKKTSMNVKKEQKGEIGDPEDREQLQIMLEFYFPGWQGEHIPPGQLKKLERLQSHFKMSGNAHKKHPWKKGHPSNKHHR